MSGLGGVFFKPRLNLNIDAHFQSGILNLKDYAQASICRWKRQLYLDAIPRYCRQTPLLQVSYSRDRQEIPSHWVSNYHKKFLSILSSQAPVPSQCEENRVAPLNRKGGGKIFLTFLIARRAEFHRLARGYLRGGGDSIPLLLILPPASLENVFKSFDNNVRQKTAVNTVTCKTDRLPSARGPVGLVLR